MDRGKGIAYCGLACAVCGHNADCAGCRNEGCADKAWCEIFRCCRGKGLSGCWECKEYPCDSDMLKKVRVRAFAAFIRAYGENELLRCLEKNKKAGIVYHHSGKLTGDYDVPQTQEGIIDMLLGKK